MYIQDLFSFYFRLLDLDTKYGKCKIEKCVRTANFYSKEILKRVHLKVMFFLIFQKQTKYFFIED